MKTFEGPETQNLTWARGQFQVRPLCQLPPPICKRDFSGKCKNSPKLVLGTKEGFLNKSFGQLKPPSANEISQERDNLRFGFHLDGGVFPSPVTKTEDPQSEASTGVQGDPSKNSSEKSGEDTCIK